MAEILHLWRGNYPLPPPINRGFVDDLRKEKYQVQSQPKTSHFPLFLQFFSLSSPSLSTVAFCNHHSNHRCFVTFSTTSGHLNSSPVAKHTPPVGLSLQQIFFSIFLPALPPATSSNRRPHHRTSSSTTRPPPCHVAFFSSLSSSFSSPPLSLLLAWTVDVNSYCSRMNSGHELKFTSTIHVVDYIYF